MQSNMSKPDSDKTKHLEPNEFLGLNVFLIILCLKNTWTNYNLSKPNIVHVLV